MINMKEYELHITVAYEAGGTIYNNCFKEYVKANNKKEAKRIIKEELKDEGYLKINVSEIYEVIY
jgi:hypothetical protein